MMKFAVTVRNKEDLNYYLNQTDIDIYILGNEAFANRLPGTFSNEELEEASNLITQKKKELYINMNIIVHNSDLHKVKTQLEFIESLPVNGILFGDLAIYRYASSLQLKQKLIYNPDTLNTNQYDAVFWKKKGIKGITVAKEIIKDEIIETAKNSEIEVSMIGHGYLNMFHSKRPLIENFFKYNNKEYDQYINNRNLHLVEEIRNESYPVFQDNHGTHIFRDKIMMSFHEIKELSNYIDVFIIDSIFQNRDYIVDVMNDYKAVLQNKEINLSRYEKNHDTGFLYKKTVYDKY